MGESGLPADRRPPGVHPFYSRRPSGSSESSCLSVTDAAYNPSMMEWDAAVVRRVNSLAGRCPALDVAMVAAARGLSLAEAALMLAGGRPDNPCPGSLTL